MIRYLLLTVDIWDRHGPPDPYTVAREAVELAQRLKMRVQLRVTPTFSIDIDPEYPDTQGIANSIIQGRNQART